MVDLTDEQRSTGQSESWLMIPDSEKYNPDPDYLRDLISRSGLSQRQCAKNLGIGYSTLRDYLKSNHASRCPYSVQFCLEIFSFTYKEFIIDFENEPSVTQFNSLKQCFADLLQVIDTDYGMHGNGYRLFLTLDRRVLTQQISSVLKECEFSNVKVMPFNSVCTIGVKV